MDEEKKTLKPEDPVPFTHEGMMQVAEMLDFLPEEARLPLLMGFVSAILM